MISPVAGASLIPPGIHVPDLAGFLVNDLPPSLLFLELRILKEFAMTQVARPSEYRGVFS
jgi:hypothetical protein